MKDSFKMVWKMATERLYLKMATSTKDNLLMGNLTGLEYLNLISINTKDNLKMDSTTEKVSTYGPQDQFIRESMKKDKSMAMEYIKKLTEAAMKEAG